jgi:hypothetical protein
MREHVGLHNQEDQIFSKSNQGRISPDFPGKLPDRSSNSQIGWTGGICIVTHSLILAPPISMKWDTSSAETQPTLPISHSFATPPLSTLKQEEQTLELERERIGEGCNTSVC